MSEKLTVGARRALLTEASLAIGEGWARTFRDELRSEGRSATGGWPGTLPEARARVWAFFGAELTKRNLPLLTREELGWTAHATYDKAKRDWLRAQARKAPARAR